MLPATWTSKTFLNRTPQQQIYMALQTHIQGFEKGVLDIHITGISKKNFTTNFVKKDTILTFKNSTKGKHVKRWSYQNKNNAGLPL